MVPVAVLLREEGDLEAGAGADEELEAVLAAGAARHEMGETELTTEHTMKHQLTISAGPNGHHRTHEAESAPAHRPVRSGPIPRFGTDVRRSDRKPSGKHCRKHCRKYCRKYC